MSSKREFQFTPMDKAPDPELGAERIPVDRYTDPAFLKLEDERIWSKTWLLAGAACDVDEPGDYFVFENLRESILVVRADDGEIRAFYNVCQHRGNQLRAPGCGHGDQLTCPFHLWTWNLDGTLKNVPEAHDFPQGTPADELGLQRLRCDTWGSFVWVAMDPDIEPLLGKLNSELGSMRREEVLTLIIFVATAMTWVARPALNQVNFDGWYPLSGLTDSGIAVISALTLFVTPVRLSTGQFLMKSCGCKIHIAWNVISL